MIRVALLGVLLMAPLAVPGQVYKWRDAKGQWHYAQSPHDKQTRSLDLAPPPQAGEGEAARRRARDLAAYNRQKDKEEAQAAHERQLPQRRSRRHVTHRNPRHPDLAVPRASSTRAGRP